FTDCSQKTHLREDIQWLLGYASSGYMLLTLILTFGEHPNSSKMFFYFNTACQGATCLIPLIGVIILTFIYYQLSKIIENVTNMESPKLWIILILLILIFLPIFNICNRNPYIRKGNPRNINRQRCLAFVSLIMDFDVLFPPLRNWSYRKEITIDQEDQNCFSINSVMCKPCKVEEEANDKNDFEESLMEEIFKIKKQLEYVSQKIDEKK
ncbi:unnamed protein product, partial [Meganyctiphanes norvegica]